MPGMIEIGDPPIAVALRRSSRARRLTLRVLAGGGGAVLTLPKGASLGLGRAFLESREGWLRSQLARVPGRQRLVAGCRLPVEGREVTVRSSPGRRVRLVDGVLEVPAGRAPGPAVAGWLKARARTLLSAAVCRHGAVLGRRPAGITLRDTRSRWGSCSASGRLMFSWRLVMAPSEVLDYVAAHEVAHLVEMNHGPGFWALVERLFPAHREARDWLRMHGGELLAWDFSEEPTP